MTKLTRNQREFLDHHDIPLSRVFDASGIRTKDYKAIMRDLDVWVAYGVSPCGAAGHTLRTRAGHCAQCNHAMSLGYFRRFCEAGEVYIAKSVQGKLVKVGFSQNTPERICQLNELRYGGQGDWAYCWHVDTEKAGRVESLAHGDLAKYFEPSTYVHSGCVVECREVFSCTPQRARKAVEKALRLCLPAE